MVYNKNDRAVDISALYPEEVAAKLSKSIELRVLLAEYIRGDIKELELTTELKNLIHDTALEIGNVC